MRIASLPAWQLAVRFGFCKRQVGSNTGGRSGYTPVNLTLPGVDTFDAERRRQKALQQLNDRLQKTDALDTVRSIMGDWCYCRKTTLCRFWRFLTLT